MNGFVQRNTKNGSLKSYSVSAARTTLVQQNLWKLNKMQYIEDLSWVVSGDQLFLNEFNKVLFSEPLASLITLLEQV